MSDTPPPQPHAPRLLIASHHAEAGLALKELGENNGYTVLRCFTATQTLERARTTRPDVIALDDSLLDADPLETSRALRDDPLVGASTPILLVTGQAATPEHHRALRAGVWEFVPYPFNVDEVAARLHTYVLFKFESERARGTEAVQDDAGLYTTRGLALRAASGDAAPPLRAGYDAVGNTRYTPVEPKHLLARATSALRLAKGDATANWIRAFDA